MANEIRDAHVRAENVVEAVLGWVGDDDWQRPTACAEWSIRDVAAHVTWGRDLVRVCAGGGEIEDRTAAPGAARPADYLDGDPLAAFRAARSACDEALDAGALARPAPAFVLAMNPSATLGDFLVSMVGDLVVHAWDIADALGRPLEVDAELLDLARAAIPEEMPRHPGFFGPPVPAPPGADDLTTHAAYLGRTSLHHDSALTTEEISS